MLGVASAGGLHGVTVVLAVGTVLADAVTSTRYATRTPSAGHRPSPEAPPSGT